MQEDGHPRCIYDCSGYDLFAAHMNNAALLPSVVATEDFQKKTYRIDSSTL